MRDFHDSPSFWFGGNNQNKALFEIYCNDTGVDGLVPEPDEEKKGTVGPWDSFSMHTQQPVGLLRHQNQLLVAQSEHEIVNTLVAANATY